jgi:hypothetical protein
MLINRKRRKKPLTEEDVVFIMAKGIEKVGGW